MHIWDIAENSLRSGASCIRVTIGLNRAADKLSIQVEDNGIGMDEGTIAQAVDPFYTNRKIRKVGLGLPLLKQSAEQSGGGFWLFSDGIGKGSRVLAEFVYSHINRAPLGDIGAAIGRLICLNENVSIEYTFSVDADSFMVTTGELRVVLEGLALNTPEIAEAVSKLLRDNMHKIYSDIY